MPSTTSRGLFVIGTDTGVGKTHVAAAIAQHLVVAGRRVGVYKPAASGCSRHGNELISDDAIVLWEAAGKPGRLAEVCPQRFEAPLAPPLAARAQGTEVDEALLYGGIACWQSRCDVVIVEGAGGLMSPFGDTAYVADLAHRFGYPLVVVAPNRVGVINQTLQTLIAAESFRDGLRVAAVVLNEASPDTEDPSRASNFDELVRRCPVPVMTRIGWRAKTFEPDVDWFALAGWAENG